MRDRGRAREKGRESTQNNLRADRALDAPRYILKETETERVRQRQREREGEREKERERERKIREKESTQNNLRTGCDCL